MDNKIKNGLGVIALIAILIFAYSSFSYVRSYDKSIEPSSFRSFSVSGEGEVTTIPDVAQFGFQVITEGGMNLGLLQTENTVAANKAVDFLKNSGIDAKDIKTTNYNVQPRYQYYSCDYTRSVEPCPPAEIVGYTVSQSFSIKIRDFGKIGSILSGIVENGANEVGSLSFTVDDSDGAMAEARAEAIAKAKAKAEEVAKEAGFKIGRLLSISENGYRPYYDSKTYGMGGISSESAAAPSIEPGSQDITVTVSLVYEIR